MSIHSDGQDGKGRDDHQGTPINEGGAGSGGTSDTGAVGGPATGEDGQQCGQEDSQQGAMPPSQTDDDQYDQGTVQREP
jgi:hypothetical protein